MKRRTFIPAIAAALAAPFVITPRVYTVTLIPSEAPSEPWVGTGTSIRDAMSDLRRSLEQATVEFDEYFAEVFEESTVELEEGATEARHWDFSCPESAYHITLS